MLPQLGLGRRREDRSVKPLGLGNARRQRNARDTALGQIFLVARADQVAAHHGLYQDGLQALDQHRAALHQRNLVGLHHRFGRLAREVIGHHMLELVEPEQRQRVQHTALVGDRLGHDHIESREPVGSHHQQAILAHRIVVAHLATAQKRQRMQARGRRRTHETKLLRADGMPASATVQGTGREQRTHACPQPSWASEPTTPKNNSLRSGTVAH